MPHNCSTSHLWIPMEAMFFWKKKFHFDLLKLFFFQYSNKLVMMIIPFGNKHIIQIRYHKAIKKVEEKSHNRKNLIFLQRCNCISVLCPELGVRRSASINDENDILVSNEILVRIFHFILIGRDWIYLCRWCDGMGWWCVMYNSIFFFISLLKHRTTNSEWIKNKKI